MKKKLKNDGIYFLGESSEDVTGSQYLVIFGNKKILLECGLYQSRNNDYLDSYKVNSRKFKFKPSEIDYLFVCHTHIDHCGLIPRLVHEGFNGKIICTANTAVVMPSLLNNSQYILEDEARLLSKKFKREYRPLYSKDDVEDTISLICDYDTYGHIYKLDDTVSFQWLNNSHCVGAAQVQIILNDGIKTKKILYTSDIGALHTKNHYLNDTEIPCSFSDVTIMESTYGLKGRSSKKSREYDLEHLKVAIDTVISRGGSLLLPCFSYSRTQELLTNIYDICSNDKNFNADVVVDSKLSCEITKIYKYVLSGDDLIKWNRIMKWDRLRLISEKADSQESLEDDSPKIVLSASGFCTNGRVVKYLQKYLADSKNMIVFSGYVGDNPSYLSYRVKNYKNELTINKKKIPNNADCITLSTFSSHADYYDLLAFGSNLNTNKLVLVHGSSDARQCLSKGLKEGISKNNKTYKVQIANMDMVVRL